MVDPFTLAVGGFALYKAAKSSKKAREREREMERRAAEEAERARRAQSARAQEIREIEAQAARASRALAEAMRMLRAGLPPKFTPPSWEEVRAVKHARQYDPSCVHFAIAGVSGTGKSSLINAIRGLANNHEGPYVAPTGVTETTRTISRYPMSDVYPGSRTVFYDVPGAGTLAINERMYFESQGLYIFDAIIVLFDTRFTQTDVAILRTCEELDIPCFVVRSKSDTHINNIISNMPGYPSDDKDDDDDDGYRDSIRAQYLPTARDSYIQQTRQSVADNLQQAGLWQKHVYLVSRSVLLSVVRGQSVGKRQCLLDEHSLLTDLSSYIPSRFRDM